MSDLNELAAEIHQTAVEKGWWADGDRNFGEMIALAHSELSEALEAWRTSEPWFIQVGPEGKPEGVGVELADTLIRILDIMYQHDPGALRTIEHIIRAKMEYNKTRPHRHGGLKA